MIAGTDVDVLWGPKSGCPLTESRDIAVIDRSVRDRGGRREWRAAVCDGATVGFDAGRWALMVAEGIIDAPTTAWTAPGFTQLIEELSDDWRASPPPFATMYHEEAWHRGAATTVAAFAVEPKGRHALLRTMALGDAMIVVLRSSGEARAWPELGPSDFGVTPDLVTTDGVVGEIVLGRTRIAAGDHVLAMSDALAQWALLAAAEGRPSWRTLAHLDPADFPTLVATLREAGELVDDDVTLVRAAIEMATPATRRSRILTRSKERAG